MERQRPRTTLISLAVATTVAVGCTPAPPNVPERLAALGEAAGVTEVRRIELRADQVEISNGRGGTWSDAGGKAHQVERHVDGLGEPFPLSSITVRDFATAAAALAPTAGATPDAVQVVRDPGSSRPVLRAFAPGKPTGQVAAELDLTPIRWDKSSATGLQTMLDELRPLCGESPDIVFIGPGESMSCSLEQVSFGLDDSSIPHRLATPPSTTSPEKVPYGRLTGEALHRVVLNAIEVGGGLSSGDHWSAMVVRKDGIDGMIVQIGGDHHAVVACNGDGTCELQ